MALTDNLVAYWKLDESSGNAADSVGSNTLTNANITYSAWKINNWASFNGTSSKLTAGSAISIEWAMTIAFWFNPTSWSYVKYLCDNTANVNRCWMWRENTWWSDWTFVNSYFIYNKWTNFVANEWYHVAIVYDYSITNKIICYKNWSQLWVDTWYDKTEDFSRTPKFWASWTNADWYSWLEDEIWIWTRALSSTEISELYNSWAWLTYPFTSAFIPKITFF